MESKKFEDFESEAKQYKKILIEYRKTQKPFVDPSFHPTYNVKERSIDIDDSIDSWKRVDEICDVPLFSKSLIDPDFIRQGELGDCYFLSALSRIAKQSYLVPLLFDRDTPEKVLGRVKESINIKCGAVVIYFNCFGRRTPVLIDTLLPMKKGQLRFSNPIDNTKSPWFCLVEKAYAKLNGSYSDIIGGTLPQAIYSIYRYYPSHKDFDTLRKPEKIAKMSLFDRIMKYQKKGAVMGTAINLSKLKNGVTQKEVENKGLIPSHSYLLLKAREHDGKRLFCLRNPWGGHEWNGDYSDESPKWTPELKEGLGWKNADDGTFWMSEDDFFRYFTQVEVSLPLQPEWFSRHYYVQLKPGDYDGYNIESSKAKIAQRPNFAFQVIDPINKGEKCRFHILIEKRQKLFDPDTNTIFKPPDYAVVLAHSDGKKLSPEVLLNSNRFCMESRMSLLCFASEVSGNDDIVTIVIHRIQACKLIEDCYVHIFCEKDFNLYDIDNPDDLIPEDVNEGIVFDNFSVKHPKVASPLQLMKVRDKKVLTFGSMDSNPLGESLIAKYRAEVESDRSEKEAAHNEKKSKTKEKTESKAKEETKSKAKEETKSKNKDETKSKDKDEPKSKDKDEPKSKAKDEKSSKNDEDSAEVNASCFFVISDLSCKNLVHNGKAGNDVNPFIRFDIADVFYKTETIKHNANPSYQNLVIPVVDPKKDSITIDVLHDNGDDEDPTKLCSSLVLTLNDMEINPLMRYKINSPLSSNDGKEVGTLSLSSKLCLKEDIDSSSKPASQIPQSYVPDDDSDSNGGSGFVLEFTVEEAKSTKNEIVVCFALGSNEKKKFEAKVGQNIALKIGNPNDESIIFCFTDKNGKDFPGRIRVKLNQIQLNARSVMESDSQIDDDLTVHLKIQFSMKKQ